MPRLSRKNLCFLVVFLVTLPVDQLTKLWILDHFAYGQVQVVIPDFFNLTHVRNPGGAFSFFASLSPVWRQAFFLGTGALAIVLLIVFLRRLEEDEWLSAAAIGGVLGGAIGNLMDRIVYGEVIDFLDFRLIGGYVWPTFNMADCWIVVGVGILMLEMFLTPEPSLVEDAEPETVLSGATDETGAEVTRASSPPELG